MNSINTPSGYLPVLRMRMTPQEVVMTWPDTPCKVATLFHGNPAEAWGYEAVGFPLAGPPKASSCERANYWVYFENNRVVGWTPGR